MAGKSHKKREELLKKTDGKNSIKMEVDLSADGYDQFASERYGKTVPTMLERNRVHNIKPY